MSQTLSCAHEGWISPRDVAASPKDIFLSAPNIVSQERNTGPSSSMILLRLPLLHEVGDTTLFIEDEPSVIFLTHTC